MLITKCWTSDYRFVLKDYLKWVKTGIIIAGVIYICSNLLAVLFLALVSFAISINLLEVKPMTGAMYIIPPKTGTSSSLSGQNTNAPSGSSAQDPNISASPSVEDSFAKLPLKVLDAQGNVMEVPDYDLDPKHVHATFGRALANTLENRANYHKDKPGLKPLAHTITHKWFEPEVHKWLTVHLREEDAKLCAEARANNQPEPETSLKKWTQYRNSKLSNTYGFRDSLRNID